MPSPCEEQAEHPEDPPLFKRDIRYVDDAERAAFAQQALETRLAEYRYETEPASAKRHLGFIIDDQPDPSPAVQADRTHVDEYGYASMLLATVQAQQKQIDELRARVDALERRGHGRPSGTWRRVAPPPASR